MVLTARTTQLRNREMPGIPAIGPLTALRPFGVGHAALRRPEMSCSLTNSTVDSHNRSTRLNA